MRRDLYIVEAIHDLAPPSEASERHSGTVIGNLAVRAVGLVVRRPRQQDDLSWCRGGLAPPPKSHLMMRVLEVGNDDDCQRATGLVYEWNGEQSAPGAGPAHGLGRLVVHRALGTTLTVYEVGLAYNA